MAEIHRIVIQPTTIRGDRGQRYRVHFEGAVLIEETWNPEFEACRALVARGVTGRLEVWRAGAAYAAMIVPDIAKAAGWTVVESDTVGPVIRRWKPRPEDSWPDADSDGSRFSPAAESDLAAVGVA